MPAPLWLALKWAAALGYSAFLLLNVHGIVMAGGRPEVNGSAIAVAGLETVGLLALLLRNKHPVAAVAIITAVLVACDIVAGNSDTFRLTLLVLATYSLVVRRSPPQALGISVMAWSVITVVDQLVSQQSWTILGPHFVLLVAAVASGLFIGSQRALLASARERAQQAERERGYHAERAVAEERLRIARDLHDVVAHHVSLLVVQAGAVRESLPPEHATREVLDSMIEGGRQAMSELRAMLDALRQVSPDLEGRTALLTPNGRDAAAAVAALSQAGLDSAPRAPQPSLGQISTLVEGAGMAGLPIKLELTGPAGELSPAVGLAAYRITQEALTNVVKHAPGAQTLVAIDCHDEGVSVRVRNGRGVLPVSNTSGNAGHGLVGMNERAAQCRGWVRAGPVDGGFAVEAWLPAGQP